MRTLLTAVIPLLALAGCAIGPSADDECDCPAGEVCDAQSVCGAEASCAGVVCSTGEVCEAGECVGGTPRPLDECVMDADCDNGRCDDGVCFTFECSEGQVESEECDLGGARERSCIGGRWGQWTACPQVSETTVDVAIGGDPAVGIAILVHGQDGALLMELETDETGRAAYTVPAITMVTALRPAGSEDTREMISLVDVLPGDAINLGFSATSATGDFGSSRTTLPGTFEGADDYDVTLGCVGTTVVLGDGVVALDVLPSCQTDGIFHMLATAYAGETPLAWSWVRSAVAVPDGVLELTAPMWSTASQTHGISLANVPAGAVDYRIHAGLRLQGRTYGTRGAISGDGVPSEGTHTFTLARGFDEDAVRSSVGMTLGPHDQPHSWFSFVAEGTEDVAVDVAAAPLIADGRIDLSLETPQLAWRNSGGPADAAFVRITWTVGDTTHNWRVTLPPDADAFSFPVLPESLQPRAPIGSDVTEAYAYRIECSEREGWDEARVAGCPGFSLAVRAATPESWSRAYTGWDFEL